MLLKKFSFYKSTALLILFLGLSFARTLLAQGHTDTGTNYGNQGVDTYAKMRHGADGRLFLDPYFLPFLKDAEGQILLDVGCGAGPWAIFAAEQGATVYGIDIQEKMIEKAKIAAIEVNVGDNIKFEVGDAGNLPYPEDYFDKAISINVGCNLPLLAPHIKELKRVLKKGGLALITAPYSFGAVFTDGTSSSEKATAHIYQQLIGTNQEKFPAAIQDLDEVYRATFAKREGKWTLVLDEKELLSGEDLWRKIPKMAVPNRYHSEQEYLSLFESEGFILKYVAHPKFQNEEERLKNNLEQQYSLGDSYVNASPFVIFIIEKQ